MFFSHECSGFGFSGDAWKALLDTAGTLIQEYDQEAMASLTKFADQLPSVMNQVLGNIYIFQNCSDFEFP